MATLLMKRQARDYSSDLLPPPLAKLFLLVEQLSPAIFSQVSSLMCKVPLSSWTCGKCPFCMILFSENLGSMNITHPSTGPEIQFPLVPRDQPRRGSHPLPPRPMRKSHRSRRSRSNGFSANQVPSYFCACCKIRNSRSFTNDWTRPRMEPPNIFVRSFWSTKKFFLESPVSLLHTPMITESSWNPVPPLLTSLCTT